jgi:hypothetical protein
MRSPRSAADQAKAYAEMIELHLFKSETANKRDTTSSAPPWSSPPTSSVYINTDATIFSSSRQMGVGAVTRNRHGECLSACSELIYEVTTLELAEALAVRRAISLAGDGGFGKLHVVSDCLSVI